eukprot:3165798-Rhodomonas_salina.2
MSCVCAAMCVCVARRAQVTCVAHVGAGGKWGRPAAVRCSSRRECVCGDVRAGMVKLEREVRGQTGGGEVLVEALEAFQQQRHLLVAELRHDLSEEETEEEKGKERKRERARKLCQQRTATRTEGGEREREEKKVDLEGAEDLGGDEGEGLGGADHL